MTPEWTPRDAEWAREYTLRFIQAQSKRASSDPETRMRQQLFEKVGDDLHQERLKNGKDLESVAAQMGQPAWFVFCLERGGVNQKEFIESIVPWTTALSLDPQEYKTRIGLE